MLDLRTIKERKYFQFTWIDGTIIHLSLPSQDVLRKVNSNFLEISDIEDVEKIKKISIDILFEIFEFNSEGRKFSKEELNVLNEAQIEALLTGYVQYMASILGK